MLRSDKARSRAYKTSGTGGEYHTLVSTWIAPEEPMPTALPRRTLAAALLVLAALPGASAEKEPRPPGRLVDLGGYRLHLDVAGKGGPAVVLLTGSGDGSWVWSLVQPEVARFTRVCSYDRAG